MNVSVVKKNAPLPRPILYKALSVGECFVAYGDLFVKLGIGNTTLTYSATSHIWYIGEYTFADDCMVTPVSANLRIKY